MTLSIVVDMNLSTEWAPLLIREGWPTIHWSDVGNPNAADSEIMEWARIHRRTIFTHDLDFTTALALTHATGPSLLQVRGQLVLPEDIGPAVVDAIRRYQTELEQGALVTVDIARSRIRVLPL